jgi:hypothetical protein
LTVDATTGAITWTPTDAQVGSHSAIIRATNSVGTANATLTVNVAANLPVVRSTFTYFGLTYPTPFAVVGDPFELQLTDTYSNSAVTWSVVTGPAGMSVDATSGLVAWTPTDADEGAANVTLRGTNYAGSTHLALSFTVHPFGTDLRPPSVVSSGIEVSNIDLYSATVSWPPATDNVAVAGYHITATSRKKVGRYYSTDTRRFDSVGTGTMFDMTGLLGNRIYNLSIRAYDEAGNESAAGQVVPFTTTANPLYPILSYRFNQPYVVVDQPMTIQLTDSNSYPSTFSLVSGPAGMTVDATTGLVSWTPTYDEVGTQTATFRATNAYGTRDVTVNSLVYFTGPVQGVGVSGASDACRCATVNWTPPTDASRVAGYHVYLKWTTGGGHYGYRTYDSPGAGTSLLMNGLVGGPVLFTVRVTPYDALGRDGVAGPQTTFILS